MKTVFEVTKDIFAIIGVIAVIWKIYVEIEFHNWIKNNW